jgi:4-alpha-glucanotransferase
LLAALSDAFKDQAVGTIGEIFDGDPPHQPRGAPVQAWSVACTLDAWRLLRDAERARLTTPMNEALEMITNAAKA